MAGKLAVVLLVVGISCVAATCYKPDWWYGKAKWYGLSKPWCPGKQAEIWSPLKLVESKVLTAIPKPDHPIKAGDPAVYWAKVTCPANSKSSTNSEDVVGDCSLTGLYIYDTPRKPHMYSKPEGPSGPAPDHDQKDLQNATGNLKTFGGKEDDGLVNWTVVCDIRRPCGDYCVGTISAVGRSTGTNGNSPSEWAIAGGTGAYAVLAAKGGVVTNEMNDDEVFTYTFRFIRDKYKY